MIEAPDTSRDDIETPHAWNDTQAGQANDDLNGEQDPFAPRDTEHEPALDELGEEEPPIDQVDAFDASEDAVASAQSEAAHAAFEEAAHAAFEEMAEDGLVQRSTD